MDEEWDIWGDEDWFDEPITDPPSEPTEPPADPYNGLSDYFAEMLGSDWESRFTPAELAEISRLSKMNDDEIYTPDPATQPGGFWASLGEAFTGTLSGLAGTAINRAGQSGSQWIKKQIPVTTAQPAAQPAINSQTLILGALALALAFYLYQRRQ